MTVHEDLTCIAAPSAWVAEGLFVAGVRIVSRLVVTVDGVGNRQGCLVRVRDGMQVEMQRGKRELGR